MRMGVSRYDVAAFKNGARLGRKRRGMMSLPLPS